jgi:hypothetical protein
MLSPMSPPCHGTPSRPLARAVTPAPPRKARHAATATQTLSSLRLALLLALLALCGCASAMHWTEAHKKRLRAEGRNIVELRPAGGGRADAHLRCNVPAAAVETCLLRLSSSSTVQEARSGECLELAVAAMAPQTLTRAGFTPESVDTLQCTYLALVGVAHKSEGPTNAALLLSLGALLGAPRDGGAWLRRLMSYDEAPLQQARVHDKEMQLRAMVQETADATDDGADYDVSDAEQLLNAAEALELYGAMRHWGLGTPDEARVRKAALVVQGCEADIRGEREHALLPPLRALLAARRTAAGRVAAEARGRAKLEALDVQSQGSCTALAASFERCSGLPLMSSPEADVRGQACTNENEKLLGRALQLTAIDDCARAFVAATDHVVALFSFMAQLEKGGLRDEVAHLVLPPPMGETPLSKSPAAVLEAYANFDVIVLRKDEDGINGGMPQRMRAASAVIQKLQQQQTQHYQGSCGVLAASFERCVALTSTAEFKRNPIAFVPQMKACAAENQGLLGRALQLSAADDCARAFVAATDNAEALVMFMALLAKAGLRDAVPYLVLPPPEGDCTHAKSPATVRAAYEHFERNYPRDDEEGIDGDMPQRVRSATAAAHKQQQKQKQHHSQAASPSREEAPDDESGSAARGGAKLAALMLLCVVVWRVAAAAERGRRRPARDSMSRERARAAAGVSAPR